MSSTKKTLIESVSICDGGKGGVGKSIVCNMMIEYKIHNKIPVRVIETDTENPDVYHVFKNKVPCEQLDLKSKEGWVELLNVIANNPNDAIVINMAAGLGGSLEKYGSFFCEDIKELNRPLDLQWTINRQKDSIILLKKALESLSTLRSCVVIKNLYFGDSNKFVLWEESSTKNDFETNGGFTVSFPELNDMIADSIANKRLSFVDVANKTVDGGFQFGHQRDLQRWVNDVFSLYENINERIVA